MTVQPGWRRRRIGGVPRVAKALGGDAPQVAGSPWTVQLGWRRRRIGGMPRVAGALGSARPGQRGLWETARPGGRLAQAEAWSGWRRRRSLRGDVPYAPPRRVRPDCANPQYTSPCVLRLDSAAGSALSAECVWRAFRIPPERMVPVACPEGAWALFLPRPMRRLSLLARKEDFWPKTPWFTLVCVLSAF